MEGSKGMPIEIIGMVGTREASEIKGPLVDGPVVDWMDGPVIDTDYPVSYTHLDVYKRQASSTVAQSPQYLPNCSCPQRPRVALKSLVRAFSNGTRLRALRCLTPAGGRSLVLHHTRERDRCTHESAMSIGAGSHGNSGLGICRNPARGER